MGFHVELKKKHPPSTVINAIISLDHIKYIAYIYLFIRLRQIYIIVKYVNEFIHLENIFNEQMLYKTNI